MQQLALQSISSIDQAAKTDIAFSGFLAVAKRSEGLDPPRRSLILNTATIVIGGFMWILHG